MKKTAEDVTLVVTEEPTKSSLLSSNPQFKAFSSSIDYGVIVANKNGIIVDFNPAACKMFGYDNDELRGQPITKIMPERFRSAHTAGIKRFNKTRKPVVLGKTLRLYGLTKAGKEFPLEISLSSWKDIDSEMYFTASMRKYSQLENNLSTILLSAIGLAAIMLVTLIVLTIRTFF